VSHRIRKVAAVGAAVIAVAGGGTALAAGNPSPTAGVYQGCLSAANGSLYTVALNPTSDPQCRPHDTAVTWNETGPAGPQGPKGDTGAMGPQGPKGDTGATGQAGADGSQGPVGLTGATGATGPTGAMGPQGPKGDAGPAGSQGPKGDAGPAGSQGPKGDTGPQGPAGSSALSYHNETQLITPLATVDVTARCPSGQRATGGGYYSYNLTTSTQAMVSTMHLTNGVPDGWWVRAYNANLLSSDTLVAEVICTG
jgi:hypothetical protein